MATDPKVILRRLWVLPPANQSLMVSVYYFIGLSYMGLSTVQLLTQGIGSTVPLYCVGKYCSANFSSTGIIFSGFFVYLVRRGDGWRAIFELIPAGALLDTILSLESPINVQFYWWSYPTWFCMIAFSLYNVRPIKFTKTKFLAITPAILWSCYVIYLFVALPSYSWKAVSWEVPQEIMWCVMWAKMIKPNG